MEVPRVSSTVVLVPPSSSATGMLAADSAAQVARQCVSIRSTVATSLDCHRVLCHCCGIFQISVTWHDSAMAPHSMYPSSHSSPCSWVSLPRLEAAPNASRRITGPGSMLVLECCD